MHETEDTTMPVDVETTATVGTVDTSNTGAAAAQTGGASGVGEAPEVDFDNFDSVQQAIARASGGDTEHPKPTVRSRRTTPKTVKSSAESDGAPVVVATEDEAATTETLAAETPPTLLTAPAVFSDDLRRLLQHYHLPVKDGETPDAAWERVRNHDRVRWQKHDGERRSLERQVSEMQGQLANIATLEPLLRAFAEERVAAQRERELATVPDPEIEPEKYGRRLLESLHERMTARERAEQVAAEQRQRYDAEMADMDALVTFDEETVVELEQTFAKNPAAHKAFQYLTEIGREEVRDEFPDATDAEIAEFTYNAQLLQLRAYRAKGWDIGGLLVRKAQRAYERGQAIYGVQPAPAPPVAASTNVNGNGNGAVRPAKPAGSPTAARIQREHAQAAARGGVSSGPRAGGPSGVSLDLTKITDPDELVNLMKRGKITEDMILSQLGVPGRV